MVPRGFSESVCQYMFVCLVGWLVVYFTIGDLKANTCGLKNTKL